MKTKQAKEDLDKSIDEEIVEPKTRGRKRASEISEQKPSQDEPKTSKEVKKNVTKARVVKKRPLGIRKALRSKKVIFVTETVKNVIKGKRRGRKPVTKTEPENSHEKEAIPLIPDSEIKKEPIEETSNSRSSSPRTAGRRQRLSSDMIMMKSVLGDSPSSLVLGPRTSPYSMRSERSNSPSMFETKNLRSGKPRKAKNNLLNEVVMKEQKKRRRLLSDSKATDAGEANTDCKKQKRGRSCSRDGSEISKCSDITESDVSLSEPLNDSDGKELNKKLDKPKTELDIDIENSIKISTIKTVPLIADSKSSEDKIVAEPSSEGNKKKKQSLKRSTSLDSDNNNSNRLILETLNTAELEEKILLKTVDNDTLFEARSSILSSMSRTFNSKEMSKNIRKARRGRKAAAATKPSSIPAVAAKNGISSSTATVSTVETSEVKDDKQETLESLSKEIDDLINDLDQNIDKDCETASSVTVPENITDQIQTKSVSKFYGLSKPLCDNNSIITPETPIKDKDVIQITNDNTPSKSDDSENIRLCYDGDSVEKTTDNSKQEITYKCTTTVASIDKLMDRLKEFEEFDKRRQRQEIEKCNDGKSLMVTSDVVLIPKSGADIKPLKDIQTVRSPEKPIEKENVLSCFENNSAISIVKRDQVRKSIDIDLPNSVTLIKRNSISARKESTSSNQSKDDAISIFEKSLGKDVTLTEIRKSVEKPVPTTAIDLHQFATLHPNNSNQGVVLDPKTFLSTPHMVTKRKSLESFSRKSSEVNTETEEKMAVVKKIKSPPPPIKAPTSATTPAPVAVKSEVAQPEALSPPLECIKAIPEDIASTFEVPILDSIKVQDTTTLSTEQTIQTSTTTVSDKKVEVKTEKLTVDKVPEKMVVDEQQSEKCKETDVQKSVKVEKEEKSAENKASQNTEVAKPVKSQGKALKTRGLTDILKSVEVPKPLETPKSSETPKISEIQISNEIQKPIDIRKTAEVSKATDKSCDILKPLEAKKLEVRKTTEVVIPAENRKSTEILKATEIQKPTEVQKTSDGQKSEIRKSIDRKSVERKSDRRSIERKSSDRKSIESQPGPSHLLVETPENQKNKENVLRTLGLLTHKAAKEAKDEKLKEKERIYGSCSMMSNKNKTKSGDYTGTLKTVIKLNRSSDREKKKYRSSLKMTFQKSKHRGRPEEDTNEDEYYTIERREGGASAASDEAEAVPEPTESKDTPNLVIPEKASSFSIHPGRLCMDQCFYCGGKFGLFDTPCHIAQMKSSERQKKVLDNEEKLTIDSCLCDACYRHVDRRANCPSYRKRPVTKQIIDTQTLQLPSPILSTAQTTEKPISPLLEDESEEETAAPTLASGRPATCHTEGCVNSADRFIKRKWLIKMRNSVNKVLKLECDYPGLHTIPLCAEHYRALAPLMACALCRRSITKHHNVHVLSHGYLELNPVLHKVGLPVKFTERPVLCKVCRYYCSVLQRPGHDITANGYTYTRKLLQIYNIDVPPAPENQVDEMSIHEESFRQTDRQKRKQRAKNKRRSTEPEKSESDSITPEKTDRILESPPQKETTPEQDVKRNEHLEEDIESLISSNKIPVPGAAKDTLQTEGTENEMVIDMDTPILPIDKQTELQYLLQKQNNPAQFLKNPANLTQKQRNILKLQNSSGVHKPGHHHKISDKNAKRIHKIGQNILGQKEKITKSQEIEMFDFEKSKEGVNILKNISLNDECTIESIPNKKPADINQLKNKWQMSESFTQVKKNLSELSKKLTVEKEPKKSSEVKYSNPVKRLETNPSISVRELFPGEEEMNLQCNVEFNNVKGVTPEGWEKCNTLIQYDLETKRLWNELQRPYGNQSSFLRHLILLEKYFRSGDLVLSHSASPNAVNYSDSVLSRLRAYDNIVNDAPRRSEPAISLIEFRKKPVNGKSLLKSNQSDLDDTKKFMPPPGVVPKCKSKDKSKSKPLPPELIAINTPKKTMQNVLHNIQQLVKGVSASDPTEVAAAPLPPPKFEPPKEKKEVHKSDISKKIKTTSKPWRPTLMPITPENLAKVAREQTQVSVDGRQLRSLVQVMSSGKQYHITLQDYNKMCIMRREKLQQLQDKEAKIKRVTTDETSIITEIQPSTMLGNGGTLLQTIEKDDKCIDVTQIGTNAATILKNVGLKNITIAPITPKTATVTSQTAPLPVVTSPSLLVTSTPMKLPQLGPAVSITTEPIFSALTTPLVMPKIPKSLTVIPQTSSIPQNIIVSDASMPSQAVIDNRP